MAGRQIVVEILGDARKFTAATREATGSATKMGKLFGSGLGMGAGISAFNLASDAISRTTDYLTDAVAMAKEEEAGIAQLGASLQANVPMWNGNTDAIEEQIGAMVRSTGFSDGEMRASLSRLVASTNNVEDAFRLQATAMDLARFKGISLEEASQALIKVEGGQYRALKELGIVLEKGATQTEALAAVQKVAGGQMAAYMDTAAGKSAVLTNRLEDMQEEIGGKLTPALVTATDHVLAFLDSLDPNAPITFTDRVQGIVDVLEDLNPMAWANNVSQGVLAGKIDDAGREAAEAARKFDTYAEMGAAARESTNDLRRDVTRLGGAFSWTSNRIQSAVYWGQKWSDLDFPGLGQSEGRAKGKASGGAASGLTWVGEQGPELVNLPAGSFVHNNAQSRQIAGAGGGITVNVNGNIYGPSGVDELMDMMARRLRLDGV